MNDCFCRAARADQLLLIVGFCALGYALYMRYLAIEQSTVGSPARPGSIPGSARAQDRHRLFQEFGLRHGRARRRGGSTCCGRRGAVCRRARRAGLGIVLYNVVLSALAIGVADPQPGAARARSQSKGQREQRRAEPQRLPVGEAFVDHDIGRRRASDGRRRLSATPRGPAAAARHAVQQKRHDRARSAARTENPDSADRTPDRARRQRQHRRAIMTPPSARRAARARDRRAGRAGARNRATRRRAAIAALRPAAPATATATRPASAASRRRRGFRPACSRRSSRSAIRRRQRIPATASQSATAAVVRAAASNAAANTSAANATPPVACQRQYG